MKTSEYEILKNRIDELQATVEALARCIIAAQSVPSLDAIPSQNLSSFVAAKAEILAAIKQFGG
jgi:hypothetical protein